MLKEIKIKNFQSHRDTNIKLHPKLTGIIGLSLSGKTAIVRAINWVYTNRPLGFRFNSNFIEDEPTKVSLIFDNKTITVTKDKKGTNYKIKYSNGKTIPFDTVGTNVPDIIKREINLLGVNIQDQLEDAFLISSSSGEISKAINKTLQTEKLDIWQSKVTSKINALNKEKKIINSDIEDIQKKLKKLDGIKDIGKLIRKLKSTRSKIQKKTTWFESINGKLADLKHAKEKVRKNRIILKLKSKIQKKIKIKNKIDDLTHEEHYLANLIYKYKCIKKSLKELDQEREETIEEYISLLKKNKKCPTCFEKITLKTVKRIKNEFYK